MNRGKKLLILLAVLAVVIAATILIVKLNEPEIIPLSTVSGESVLQIDVANMKRLQWTYGEAEYDFNFSAEGWTCNIQPDYVPDAERMARILVNLKDIRAERIINEPQPLSVYGLENPSCVVTVDGVKISFGDESSLNSTVYMSLGDGKVYMVENSYYFAFTFTREELVQINAVPDMPGLNRITVENKSGTFTLEKLEQSGKTYSDHYAWFEAGSEEMISQDVVAGIVAYLEDMDWLSCLNANPQNLADYGLDAPIVTCTAQWDGGSYTFYVGGEADQGYYAAVEGENRVYQLDVTTAQVLDAISADMLECTDVLKMDWNTVTSVDVELDGQAVTITNNDGTWSISSKDVDAMTVLEAINEMPATPGEDLSAEGLVTELKLTIHRNTETFNPVVLTFYRHDGTNCIMQLDGNAPMLVLREDVVLLKEAFNALILG